MDGAERRADRHGRHARGRASTGDGTLTCTWSFEDSSGGTVYETATGCRINKTFTSTGTKYVKLTVRDADGDTDANQKSFSVAAPTPTPTPDPVADAHPDAGADPGSGADA